MKDKKTVKEALIGKDKGKQKAEPEEPKEQQPDPVEPQDCGCDVTCPDKQSMLLLGSYKGLPPLASALSFALLSSQSDRVIAGTTSSTS